LTEAKEESGAAADEMAAAFQEVKGEKK